MDSRVQILLISINFDTIFKIKEYLSNHLIFNRLVTIDQDYLMELNFNYDLILFDKESINDLDKLVNILIMKNKIDDLVIINDDNKHNGIKTFNDIDQLLIHKNIVVKNKNICFILKDLGIPSHLDGHKYLKYIFSRDSINDFYETTSSAYNVNISLIERSIRYAIDRGSYRIRSKGYEHYFGNSIDFDKNKPTNKEFIYCIYEFLNK